MSSQCPPSDCEVVRCGLASPAPLARCRKLSPSRARLDGAPQLAWRPVRDEPKNRAGKHRGNLLPEDSSRQAPLPPRRSSGSPWRWSGGRPVSFPPPIAAKRRTMRPLSQSGLAKKISFCNSTSSQRTCIRTCPRCNYLCHGGKLWLCLSKTQSSDFQPAVTWSHSECPVSRTQFHFLECR